MKHRRFLALLLALCLAATCVFPAAAVETLKNPATAKVQAMFNARPVPGTAVPADTSETVIAVGTVDVDTTLNVRSGPGTSYSKVGTLIGGQRVAFYETKTVGTTTWGRMDLGWISMAYVVLDEDLVFTDAGYCGTGEEVLWGYAEDPGVLVILGEGPMLDYPYSAIDEQMVPWLAYRSGIKTLIVDYGITYIGDCTFNDISALRFAYIADSVTAMGDNVFYNDTSLLATALPDSIVSVGTQTFLGCYNLQLVLLPANLTEISLNMFAQCTSLVEAEIPAAVTVIADGAFKDCTGLTAITLPEGLTSIGEFAFSNCTGLTHVDFPKSLMHMKRAAFYNSYGIKTMKFFGNAPSFGSDLFADITADVYYPANNFTWSEEVRQDYGGTLTWHAVEIPGSENPNITGTCGDNLTWTLTEGALTISGTGDMYDYYESTDYGVAPWYNYRQAITRVVLPTGLTSIGNYAFYGTTALTAISIPDSVTDIGEGAFYDSGLTAVDIPDSVAKIGKRVFFGCDSLSAVTLPAGLTLIRERTFCNCSSLKEITIPAQVEIIDVCAFEYAGLEKITFLGDAPAIDSNVFVGVTATAYYPAGNTTWTDDVKQNYCGSITWESWGTAAVVCGDELTWTLEEGVLTITGTGDMYDYDAGGAPWSGSADAITQVVLPEGLTSIGAYAFASCTGLYVLEIPAAVTSIGAGAFSQSALMEITFLGDAPVFGADVFAEVVADAYYPAGNSTWTSAVRQDYGGTIGWAPWGAVADGNCGIDGDNLTWVLTEAGVLIISGQGEMKNYKMVTPFSTGAPWLSYTDQIKNVVIEPGVTTIGNYAFYELNAVESFELPEGLVSIGQCAFQYAFGIPELDLPESLEEIGPGAFSDLRGLTTITIPAATTVIGEEAFSVCRDLQTIHVAADNPNYSSDDYGFLFNKDKTELIVCPCGFDREYAVPDSVTRIADKAFAYSGATLVKIPASVTEIVRLAFFYCESLSEIHFLGDAPVIGEDAFFEVVATAYYPAENATWTADVMQNYGGTLTWTPYGGSEPANICGDNLTWTLADGVLTISGTGDMYDYTGSYEVNNAPWGRQMYEITQVILPEGLTSIGDYAFCTFTKLTSLEIPDTVTDIGVGACFQAGLTSLEIPGSVETIGTDAFAHCADLTQVTLGSGVKTIGERAFAECWELRDVQIPDSATAIGSRAFYDCAELAGITLPAGLTAIEDETFTACVSLTEITIPANVASIGAAAFRDAGLKTLIFLGNAPAIAGDSFGNVEANAYYPAGNATWTADVMQNYGGTLTWNTHNIGTEPSVTYTSVSLSMAGDIGLNYYVKLSDDIILDSGAYMQFTFGDQVQTVPLSDALLGDDGSYRFSCAIPAKRMTDVVTGQMYTSNGPVGEAKQYSVKQYCTSMKDYVEENGLTGYDNLLNLLDAMLNYGGYSQLSFGYNTSDLANAGLSEEAKALPETLDASAYAHSMSGTEEGIAVYSASLLLESKTTIRFYFKLTGDRWIDDFGLTVDGQSARLTEAGDLCYVDVPNVAAKDLDTMHTVTFDGGLTVSYCGLSYVNQMLTWSGAAEADVNTAKALYLYNQAANAYFGD